LITSDPKGRPIIAGTYVTVEEVLKELAASKAVDVILTTHPELDRDAYKLRWSLPQGSSLSLSLRTPHHAAFPCPR